MAHSNCVQQRGERQRRSCFSSFRFEARAFFCSSPCFRLCSCRSRERELTGGYAGVLSRGTGGSAHGPHAAATAQGAAAQPRRSGNSSSSSSAGSSIRRRTRSKLGEGTRSARSGRQQLNLRYSSEQATMQLNSPLACSSSNAGK